MDAPMFPVLPASDMTRARNWYRDRLGLKPTDEMPDGSAMYESGGAPFLLYPSEFAGTNKATAAGFIVDDFDAAIIDLRDNGVAFEEFDLGDGMATVDGVMTDPDGNKSAWFKDSEGNIIAVAQRP